MYRTLIFLLLMVLWVIFSGQFDAFHLGLGVLSAGFVTWISSDCWFEDRQRGLGARLTEAWAMAGYTLWLSWQVVVANFHVLYLSLHPRSLELLKPRVVLFKTTLKSDFAKYVFANSITLTPGTVTIMIMDDQFLVHAISRKTAEALPGEMEARVAAAFDNHHKEEAG